jgi:hypothetical protein
MNLPFSSIEPGSFTLEVNCPNHNDYALDDHNFCRLNKIEKLSLKTLQMEELRNFF